MKESNNKHVVKKVLKPGFHVKTNLLDKEMNAFLDELRSFPVEKEDLSGTVKEFVTLPQAFKIYQKNFGKSALVLTSIQHRVKIAHEESKFSEDLIFLDDVNITTGKCKFFINRLSNSLLKELFLPHAEPVPKGLNSNVKNLHTFFRNEFLDDEEDGF